MCQQMEQKQYNTRMHNLMSTVRYTATEAFSKVSVILHITSLNPLKGRGVSMVTLCHPGLTYSGLSARVPECQKLKM